MTKGIEIESTFDVHALRKALEPKYDPETHKPTPFRKFMMNEDTKKHFESKGIEFNFCIYDPEIGLYVVDPERKNDE